MNEFYGYKGLGYEPYSWIQLVKKAIRIIVFMDGMEMNLCLQAFGLLKLCLWQQLCFVVLELH